MPRGCRTTLCPCPSESWLQTPMMTSCKNGRHNISRRASCDSSQITVLSPILPYTIFHTTPTDACLSRGCRTIGTTKGSFIITTMTRKCTHTLCEWTMSPCTFSPPQSMTISSENRSRRPTSTATRCATSTIIWDGFWKYWPRTRPTTGFLILSV